MLHSRSVRARLLVSVGAYGLRALIGFASGLLVARGLSPSGYGDMMFLLGSFAALRSALDMGSSTAFYTFISREKRSNRFYWFYFAWLTVQFVLTLFLVTLIIPDNLFGRIWLGHSRGIVALAFLASFLQQQVWQTVGQIGEAQRKTVKVQLLNISVAASYFAIIWILTIYGGLSIERIFLLLGGQYALATLLAYQFFKEHNSTPPTDKSFSFKCMAREYWVYCKPLALLSILNFLYDFLDKWMLQRFGGSTQQGFYQIAFQFSTISLLATTSILNIFWKEIAEASAKQDHPRVASLYRKISRALFMLGAIVTGFLMPWSKQIVSSFLGQNYLEGWPVLAIMFLYPIYQSMGQIGGTMIFATGHTSKYLVISVIVMLVTMPLSYLMLAPASSMLVPGFGLGAIGIAVKMVVVGVISGNLQAFIVSRYCGIKFDWFHQIVGIALAIGFGYLAKFTVGSMIGIHDLRSSSIQMAPAALLYFSLIASSIWFAPWVVGMGREELKGLLVKFSRLFI